MDPLSIGTIGVPDYRGHQVLTSREVCTILPEDRRRHLAIFGKSSMGKPSPPR